MRDLEQLDDDLYEISSAKQNIVIRQPVQFGKVVYDLSKLRVLTFALEWFGLIERAKYALILSDTDSLYVCFAHRDWEQCCRANVSANDIARFKTNWFAKKGQEKIAGYWHVEFRGKLIVVPCPKLYIAVGEDDSAKIASRGISQKHNQLDSDIFKRAIFDGAPQLYTRNRERITTQNFQIVDSQMVTRQFQPANFSAFYFKRVVLPDLVNTTYLPWKHPEWLKTILQEQSSNLSSTQENSSPAAASSADAVRAVKRRLCST